MLIVTITNCIIDGTRSCGNVSMLELPSINKYNGDVEYLLIMDEYIFRPVSAEEILECLAGREETVRIGFCKVCGIPAAYDVYGNWNHPNNIEEIIACIIES